MSMKSKEPRERLSSDEYNSSNRPKPKIGEVVFLAISTIILILLLFLGAVWLWSHSAFA